MKNIAKAEALKLSKTKEIIFSFVFTTLAVYTPTLIHYFAGIDGGRTFLPMPFFVLLAGLMLGWRAGLATALMSPIVSYLISGMPLMNILPFITLQLVAYGVVVGIIKEKYNAVISVTVAIIAGWLAIGISLLLFSKMNALNYVAQGLKMGIWGIAIQLVLLPAIAILAKKHFGNENQI